MLARSSAISRLARYSNGSAVAEGSSSGNPRRIRHIPSLWSSLHRLTRVRLWWRLALGVFWHRSRPYPATRNHVKALASDSVAHDMHRGASYAYGRLHQMPKTRPASAADVLRGRRPTGAREQVCGPGVILTTGVKGAREGARVKIMLVGCPQTAGRASRSAQASISTALRASGSMV